jgi:hypothetical protein
VPPRDDTKRADAERLRYARDKDAVRSESFANDTGRKDTSGRRAGYEPEGRNVFQGGIEYAPKRGLRYVLGYRRLGLLGDDALSTQLGFQNEPSGDVEYTRDFALFGAFERRLQISVRGFSDFTPERRIAGTDVDERRTGGEARTRLDLLRDLDGHSAQLTAGASWRESRTDRDGERVARRGITLVDVGALYLRSRDGTPSAARVEIEPLVTSGYDDDTGRWFARPSLDLRYHRFVGDFLQWDVRGRGATASGGTPDVELPSFGGDTSVRGYRPDAGLGRTAWALQNELWLPLRIGLGLPSGWQPFLRRNVAVAVLGDIGGLHGARDDFSGIKGGAGLGLRVVWQDHLTFRLDWAHTLGGRDHGRGGSGVYFTVTTRQSL